MILRELLKIGKFGTCKFTIVGYCEEEMYEYLSEVDIEEHFDIEDNLVHLHSIVLEPWWGHIMNRTVEDFSLTCDDELTCKILTIRLADERLTEKFEIYGTTAFKILDYIADMEDDQEVLNICKTSGIEHLEELSAYVYPQYIDGKTDEEKLSIITQVMEESYRWNMEKLRKYYLVYGNYREYLLADCENDEEKEKIQEWLKMCELLNMEG